MFAVNNKLLLVIVVFLSNAIFYGKAQILAIKRKEHYD